MNRVMERRNLLAGLFVVVVSMFMLTGTAAAHSAHKSKKVAPKVLEEGVEAPACKIVPEPSNPIDIGEFGKHSSIGVIFEIECKAEFSEKFVRIASNQLWAKCDHRLRWLVAGPETHEAASEGENGSKEFKAELDDAGNATIAMFGGPSCAAEGEALVTVDLESGTHPTTTTAVMIEEPKVTKEGIELFPLHGEKEGGTIENATDSGVVGLAVIEYSPTLAEEKVSVTDRQLFEKCKFAPKLAWFEENGEKINAGLETTTTLDNDGNAFVVFEGGGSCKSGNSLFEASLEEPPFTTLEANYKVLPPQSTFP